MDLTGAGNNVMAGIYVGPYYAYINNNGVSTPVICDDFADESFLPDTWTADIFTPPDYVTTRDAQKWNLLTPAQQGGYTVAQNYDAVGYLASEMLANSNNQSVVGELDFALWNVFDPTAIPYLANAYSGTCSVSNPAACYAGAANAYYADARSAVSGDMNTGFTSYISGYSIYSPDQGYPYVPGNAGPPQEFLVRMPEPPALAILGLDMSGLAGLVFLLRRRMRRPQS
ncbi:MAG: hypothetical protein ABI165_20600 [Bryobacteraceae bacterium]